MLLDCIFDAINALHTIEIDFVRFLDDTGFDGLCAQILQVFLVYTFNIIIQFFKLFIEGKDKII